MCITVLTFLIIFVSESGKITTLQLKTQLFQNSKYDSFLGDLFMASHEQNENMRERK